MANQNAGQVVQGWMTVLGARCVIAFVFFFAFFMGCWVAGAGLHDPDTCWLLALGKNIFEHGGIPPTDPFSYTFGCLEKDGTVNLAAVLGQVPPPEGRKFVPYQWLSEVVFFLAYKINAGYSLLLLANIVLLTAFLTGPLMLFRSLRSPMLPAVGMVILGVVAASFHFLVRPEIFSYLFFLVWIGLFVRVRLKLENNRPFRKRDIGIVLPMVGLMALWSNMHTGFTSVFIALSIYCVVCTIEALVRRSVRKSVLILPWMSFFAMLLASCLNPFGVGLWKYIPELFFSPLNKFINELSSINKASLTEWTFYPYFLLGGVVSVMVAKAVLAWRKRGRYPIGFAYSIVMPLSVFVAGICCIRLIPFVAVILCAEVAWLLKWHTRVARDGYSAADRSDSGLKIDLETGLETVNARLGSGTAGGVTSKESEADKADDSVEVKAASTEQRMEQAETVNSRVSSMLGKGGWPAALLLFSIFGVFMISTRVVKPTIPQGSSVFPSPFPAIKVLAKNLPEGRVLNNSQFGDMMIWHLISQEKPILGADPFQCPPAMAKPKVFIDTRFDMYGAPLVSDYYTIKNAKPGWNELFQKYKFDWVFMPPHAPIVKELSKDPGWKSVYNETDAVILVRENSH
ncbi:MAG: hypothetical protein SGJ27_13255 [Candidatus Melainabacteria bacterium]|nr:hypothetical protein [Candidatus Melainabacteria bacterium]